MLVRIYSASGGSTETEARYSPGTCIGCRTATLAGSPDPKHISTSFVERSNLSMRMGMRLARKAQPALHWYSAQPAGSLAAKPGVLQVLSNGNCNSFMATMLSSVSSYRRIPVSSLNHDPRPCVGSQPCNSRRRAPTIQHSCKSAAPVSSRINPANC